MHRRKFDELIRALEETDDKIYDTVKESPIKIINAGENIDMDLYSPQLFVQYILSYYQRRTEELKAAGKYFTSHWDGKVKHLMPYLRKTGLTGLECVPPKPQGDVTLEELKQGLEDKVLVDGIQAVLFLPDTSDRIVVEFARKVLEMFSPHLILGISDMLPPNGDIEKAIMVSEIVEDFSC